MTLNAMAQEAASHWGGTPLALIRNRENAVFRMKLANGSHAALRLHREGYQADAAIRSELWWCAALGDQGLPVPRPIAARGGDFLIHTRTGRAASAVEWLPGTPLGEAGVPLSGGVQDQIAQHHALGRLLAQLHDATDTMALPPDFTRPRWDIDGLTGDAPFWGRFWDHPALTNGEVTVLQSARSYLRAALQEHERTHPLGLIHADVLRENILVNDGSLSIIDFDDSGIGFRLYDLGTALSQCLYEPNYPQIRQALLCGYQTLRPANPRMVDILTLARTLASVGWTMPRLAATDPIMRSHIARALHCAEMVLR